MTAKRDTKFLLRRAEEEAILAVQAGHCPAGDAHRDLSLRYSVRAREALSAGDAAGTEAGPAEH